MDPRRIEITLAVLGALITVTLVACGGGSEAELLEDRARSATPGTKSKKRAKDPNCGK